MELVNIPHGYTRFSWEAFRLLQQATNIDAFYRLKISDHTGYHLGAASIVREVDFHLFMLDNEFS